MKDTLYIDRINGKFEAHTYSDGDKILVKSSYNISDLYNYAKKHDYKVVEIF